MILVSPPELERAFPGPCWSSNRTRAPERLNWYAVQAPKTPAPITTRS